MKTEQELEKEFDELYAKGEFDDQMLLDDELPDFKDHWVGEMIEQELETRNKQF